MWAKTLAVLGCVVLGFPALAQEDADARIARTTWHSAVVPGWGQVNNGKWWKVPLVYGALGVSGYYIQTEGRLYKGYRDGYRAMTDEDPPPCMRPSSTPRRCWTVGTFTGPTWSRAS